MEHNSLPKVFETLLPIIIFVFWAMFSVPAKKKQKERAEQEKKTEANGT